MAKSLMIIGAPSAPEGSEPAEGEVASESPGLATVRISLTSLPEGVAQGSRGKASFVVNEIDGDAAEITIDGVESVEEEQPASMSGEDELKSSLTAAMR